MKFWNTAEIPTIWSGREHGLEGSHTGGEDEEEDDEDEEEEEERERRSKRKKRKRKWQKLAEEENRGKKRDNFFADL